MTPCQLSILAIGLVAVGAVAFAIYTRLERQRFVRQMGQMAFHDALTSLPNRLLFMDRASIAFANAKRSGTLVAVVFIDLDRFKLVNDSFGHDVGDEVLRGVARRLREQVREVDTVARLGGDEFTLLMPGIHQPSDIAKISSKLVEAFR